MSAYKGYNMKNFLKQLRDAFTLRGFRREYSVQTYSLTTGEHLYASPSFAIRRDARDYKRLRESQFQNIHCRIVVREWVNGLLVREEEIR